MAEYQFIGESNAVAYEAPGYVVMKKYVDVAALIAAPQMLALASAPNTPLTSFTGFAAADVVNLFHVPAGFVARMAGMYVQSADTNAATIALGIGGATAAFMAATAINSTGATITVVGDAYGANSLMAKEFVANDTVDALLASATAIDAKIHFFLEGYKAFDITSVV